jgi:LPXTG-motif cell wall-anchored protein
MLFAYVLFAVTVAVGGAFVVVRRKRKTGPAAG